MKKIIFATLLVSASITAFAAVGSVYSSKTTTVKIKSNGNQYQVTADLGVAGCGGNFSGVGTLNGSVLTVFDAATAKEDGGDRSDYTMKIRFSNNFNNAKIIHGPGMYYSGASCSFTDGGNPNLKKVR